MDSCGSVVFSCLTVKDTVLAAECCKEWRKYSQDAINERADKWLAETSRAWAWRDSEKGLDEVDVSADELPDDQEALRSLDTIWRDRFVSPTHILKTVASEWCGGWPRFLYARETRARRQPRMERGKHVEFTTIGDLKVTPFALIFDIHCDGMSKWCGVYPFHSRTLGATTAVRGDEDFGVEEDIDLTMLYPISTKTLGDSTDASTIHPMNHHDRPPRYLLSTDAEDIRSWSVNVSLVSPLSSETLIFSISDIVPKSITTYISKLDSWEDNSGYDDVERWKEDHEAGIRDGAWYADDEEYVEYRRKELGSIPRPNTKLLRCSELDPVTRSVVESDGDVLKGLDEDGQTTTFPVVEARFCYWLDKRNPVNDRLHLTLDFYFEDGLWSGVFLNPPLKKPIATFSSSSQSERPAKRHRHQP